MRNHRSRISLIKQLDKGWNTDNIMILENGIISSNQCGELSCDRSLIYGDIGFGDDELNWVNKQGLVVFKCYDE